MEVPVDERSELAGKTVRETGLRDRDVIVLTIQRGSVSIANPKGSREVLAGDVLLCFGKTMTLKSLVPDKPRRRRRRAAELAPTALAGDEPIAEDPPKPSDGG